jgi:hypothetical protein
MISSATENSCPSLEVSLTVRIKDFHHNDSLTWKVLLLPGYDSEEISGEFFSFLP